MDNNLFQAPAELLKIETLTNTLKLTFETQELPEADVAKLFGLRKLSIGWLLFKSSEIKTEDIPEYDPEQFDEDKSPSQRLRDVLFVYYKQKGMKPEGFNAFYAAQLEKITEQYKAKLT